MCNLTFTNKIVNSNHDVINIKYCYHIPPSYLYNVYCEIEMSYLAYNYPIQ